MLHHSDSDDESISDHSSDSSGSGSDTEGSGTGGKVHSVDNSDDESVASISSQLRLQMTPHLGAKHPPKSEDVGGDGDEGKWNRLLSSRYSAYFCCLYASLLCCTSACL